VIESCLGGGHELVEGLLGEDLPNNGEGHCWYSVLDLGGEFSGGGEVGWFGEAAGFGVGDSLHDHGEGFFVFPEPGFVGGNRDGGAEGDGAVVGLFDEHGGVGVGLVERDAAFGIDVFCNH